MSIFRSGKRGIVVGVVISLLLVGSVLAAWLVTKQTSGIGMVIGTFSLSDELVCTNALPLPDEVAYCTATLVNEYDQPINVTAVSMVADPSDLIYIWEYTNLHPLPMEVAPGASFVVEMQWRANEGRAPGPIGFTMDVTAQAD